jgi:uracil-DNA glycosylase family 4
VQIPGVNQSGSEILAAVEREVVECQRCPRLVEWRTEISITRKAAYQDQRYWGAGIPGFGDPTAQILVLGLAPAAHGANRTGRMFTGDRSGEWLFRALHRAGLASQAESISRDDGLELTDTWVTSAVKCAPPQNTPTPSERSACAPYFAREIAALGGLRVVVCLGAFGWTAAGTHFGLRPRPRFGHGAEVQIPDGPLLIGSYHPSQHNTFTGRLTEEMFDAVFSRAVRRIRSEATPL